MKCGDQVQNVLSCAESQQFDVTQDGKLENSLLREKKKARKRIPSVEVVRKIKSPGRKPCVCEETTDRGRNAARIIITAGDETKVSLNLILREVADEGKHEEPCSRENVIKVDNFCSNVAPPQTASKSNHGALTNDPCNFEQGTCTKLQSEQAKEGSSRIAGVFTEVKSKETLNISATVVEKQPSGESIVSGVIICETSEKSYTAAAVLKKSEPPIDQTQSCKTAGSARLSPSRKSQESAQLALAEPSGAKITAAVVVEHISVSSYKSAISVGSVQQPVKGVPCSISQGVCPTAIPNSGSYGADVCQEPVCKEKRPMTAEGPGGFKVTSVVTEVKSVESLMISQTLVQQHASGGSTKADIVVEKTSETSYRTAEVIVEQPPSTLSAAGSGAAKCQGAPSDTLAVSPGMQGSKSHSCRSAASTEVQPIKSSSCRSAASTEVQPIKSSSCRSAASTKSQISKSPSDRLAVSPGMQGSKSPCGSAASKGQVSESPSDRLAASIKIDAIKEVSSKEILSVKGEVFDEISGVIASVEVVSKKSSQKSAELHIESRSQRSNPSTCKQTGAMQTGAMQTGAMQTSAMQTGAMQPGDTASCRSFQEVTETSHQTTLYLDEPEGSLLVVAKQRSTHSVQTTSQISIARPTCEPPRNLPPRDGHRKSQRWIFLLIFLVILPVFMIIGAILGLALCHPLPFSYNWPFSKNSVLGTLFLHHSQDSVHLHGAF